MIGIGFCERGRSHKRILICSQRYHLNACVHLSGIDGGFDDEIVSLGEIGAHVVRWWRIQRALTMHANSTKTPQSPCCTHNSGGRASAEGTEGLLDPDQPEQQSCQRIVPHTSGSITPSSR